MNMHKNFNIQNNFRISLETPAGKKKRSAGIFMSNMVIKKYFEIQNNC